jgi:hypothetical protein
VLGGEEEVVVFVKQGPVEGDQGLPLIVVELVGRVALRTLIVVHLDALALYHDEAGVDAFDFGHELLLGDGPGLGLLDDLCHIILGGWGCRTPGWERVRLAVGLGERAGWALALVAGYVGLVVRTGPGSSGVIVRGPEGPLLKGTPVELTAVNPSRGGCGPSFAPLG